jgi:hypothetical protein
MDGNILPVEALESDEGWLCSCGHWEETDLHCSYCGGEPPWGCPCAFCEDRDADEWDDDLEVVVEETPFGEDAGVGGCRFPGACLMPGPHLPSECHTADMLEGDDG